jgi:hypothetical protein
MWTYSNNSRLSQPQIIKVQNINSEEARNIDYVENRMIKGGK